LHFTGRTGLKRQRVTLIGAGGMAKAVAWELYRMGAKVLILNRSLHKARDLASPYKFAWGDLGSSGVEMMDHYRDIIIQATPAGMAGNGDEPAAMPADTYPQDILEMYRFSGREKVMDLVYDPEMTPFLKRAVRAGCLVINGYDMLTRQARYQYTVFTGREFPEYLARRVRFSGN
jgi:3-dehydroquinate dehydratase/shikimate dehydrogenase